MVYIAADHRGFDLKNKLFKRLTDEGYKITDLGNDHFDSNDDYPDFARKVAMAVLNDSENRGILLCGSGVGMDITANKFEGIRAALVSNEKIASQARKDDDVNIISLSADILDEDLALRIIKIFLETPFDKKENHLRRIEKIEEI
jgi:ribose 5-phosphate isomerase B